MLSARTSLTCLRISSGMSRRSFSFFLGRMTMPAPARCAARILDFSPPIGRTRPRSVISPVIATSLRTGMPASAETIAVAMVTPADGPSLGVAPAGTWMWSVCFSKTSRSIPSSAACDRIQDSAARADSRITSPSWPVRMKSSLPSMSVTSIATTSPPTSVTTRPVAEPVWSSASSSPYSKRGGPRYSSSLRDVDHGLALAALGHRPRDLAHDVGELALEVPDAGLVRVGLDELGEDLVRDLHVLGLEPVVLHLLGDQEPARDLDLLLLGVARQLDDLHPVAQGGRDGVEQVGGGDEQHLAQVERDLEVVVLEAEVLLRVEHLEQRGRRVAPEVHADLVDLVEHEHRVVRAGGLDALDDPAGQRADVGAPVAADLRLVVDAAEAHAGELAAHRLRDALAQARSCPRREGRRTAGLGCGWCPRGCAPRGTRGCAP